MGVTERLIIHVCKEAFFIWRTAGAKKPRYILSEKCYRIIFYFEEM